MKRFVIERRITVVVINEVIAEDLNKAMQFVRDGVLYDKSGIGIRGFSTPKEEGIASLRRRKDLE